MIELFYYKTEKDGKVERLFTSNYPEYNAIQITKEEYQKNLEEERNKIGVEE